MKKINAYLNNRLYKRMKNLTLKQKKRYRKAFLRVKSRSLEKSVSVTTGKSEKSLFGGLLQTPRTEIVSLNEYLMEFLRDQFSTALPAPLDRSLRPGLLTTHRQRRIRQVQQGLYKPKPNPRIGRKK